MSLDIYFEFVRLLRHSFLSLEDHGLLLRVNLQTYHVDATIA